MKSTARSAASRLVSASLAITLAGVTWAVACGGTDEGSSSTSGGASCGTCPDNRVCDANLGCVECTVDSQCGAAQPHCIGGECVDCASSTDCSAGESCWPREHECQPACQDNGDCGENNTELCDTETGACVACLTDADCDGDELCNPTFGQCSECAKDSDCGAVQPHCDLPEGDCEECLADGHCALGEVCRDHQCVVENCDADEDCGEENPACDIETGDCLQCITDDHCASQGGGRPHCSEERHCEECLLAEHCDPDEMCVDFKCE